MSIDHTYKTQVNNVMHYDCMLKLTPGKGRASLLSCRDLHSIGFSLGSCWCGLLTTAHAIVSFPGSPSLFLTLFFAHTNIVHEKLKERESPVWNPVHPWPPGQPWPWLWSWRPRAPLWNSRDIRQGASLRLIFKQQDFYEKGVGIPCLLLSTLFLYVYFLALYHPYFNLFSICLC